MQNGILFSHRMQRNPGICSKLDETGGYYVKLNKQNPEKQIPYILPDMQTLVKVDQHLEE